MPLQAASSAVYWAEADLDEEDALLEELSKLEKQEHLQKRQYGHTKGSHGLSSHLALPTMAGETLVDGTSDVNIDHLAASLGPMARSEQAAIQEEDEDAEEYTYNPDAELEEAQSDRHAAYQDGQQMYEKIGFGDFARYMANKRRKLGVQQGAARLNANEDERSETLKGLRIHINGETEPPAHILSHLVVLHGGVYVPYLDAKKTSATHIIASNLTPSKRIAFKEYKVVKADWLLDTIRDRKIKDWRLYREDAAPVKLRDVGVAPAGTQIAQPRLAFAQPLGKNQPTAVAASEKETSPSKTVQSPRRLPPPTSDPVSIYYAAAAAKAAGAPLVEDGSPLQGWYPTKSNAKSAELLKDERWRLNETAVNTTEFLDKYYRQSRLHWLSTWKAELKKMVGELSEGREIDLTKRSKGALKGNEQDNRVVLHVDFDSFFVSASLLARPDLKGQPVVVCHASVGDTSSSSEIASASYEAREFGIRNGMSLGSAKSRCPHIQTVPYDFELYRLISSKFYRILFSHALDLEAVSIDEAYISLPPQDPPRTPSQLLRFAEDLRKEILDATGCQTSVGVSHNKLLARLATNRAKPSSSFQIGNTPTTAESKEALRAFLHDIDVENLPGIGWKRANDVEDKLKELSTRLKSSHFSKAPTIDAREPPLDESDEVDFSKVGHLLSFSKNQLKEALGEKTGEMVHNYARGIDSRELETENIRKSVSAEVNYGIRFRTDVEVEKFCYGLGGEVASRLSNLGYKGRQLTLKVMKRAKNAPIEPPKFLGHGICDTFNASRPVDLTNDAKIIGRVAWELMQSLGCPPQELRGIGLQMQKLENVSSASDGIVGDGGQSKLTFKIKEVKEVPTASPILIGTSSSPGFLVDKRTSAGRELRSSKGHGKVSYVEVSSEDDDVRVLTGQAPSKSVQSRLNGPVVKRAKSDSAAPSKGQPILISATPLPADNQQQKGLGPKLASPTKLSDRQLALLGIDGSFFRSCSRMTQDEILKECLLQRGSSKEVHDLLVKSKRSKKTKPLFAPVFEEAAANAAKREEAKQREKEKAERKIKQPTYYKLDQRTVGSLPTFVGKCEVDDIRNVLARWVEGVGLDHGPALDEVEQFSKYCLKTVSKDPRQNGGRGQDVAKIADILDWWKYLIERRSAVAAYSGSQKTAGDAWNEAWDMVLTKVNAAVTQDFGGPLYIRTAH